MMFSSRDTKLSLGSSDSAYPPSMWAPLRSDLCTHDVQWLYICNSLILHYYRIFNL